MTIDMSQFLETFYEESFEGLDIMENGLLEMDAGDGADGELINGIFRAAHSIKGGSATFGLEDVASFTHVMETLLDEIRDGRRVATAETVELLLTSVDILREMLTALREGRDVNRENAAGIQARLEALLEGDEVAAAAPHASGEGAPSGEDGKGWKIEFRPYPHLFRTGNDPVRMFRELAGLGEMSVEVDASRLPAFEDLDAEESHLGWTLTLRGDAIDRAAVEEVFEWVDGDCDLSISELSGTREESVESVAGQVQATPETTPETREPAVAAPAAAEEKTAAPSPAPGSAQAGETPPAARRKPAGADAASSIRVSTDKIDTLINMVGELVITQSMLGQMGEELGANLDGEGNVGLYEKLRDGLAELERNTRELQESVMRIRMLPISFAFNRFPRMVHDLTTKLGKKVELTLSGEGTELDKTVMEKIGDPLVHLVRNALDHGIEAPDVRLAAGKPEIGSLHLNAYHQGGNIVIEIRDDGAGFNKEKILAKAVERGLVGEDETLSDERIYDLIFAPGFSTADVISDVSGRGVGMDVVKRNITDLGGTIEIESEPGRGSTMTIRLPLTLAILDGQLVRVGDEIYIIPLVSIVESLQIRPELVSVLAGRAEMYKLRDDYIPIVRLYEIFGIDSGITDLRQGLLVVVESGGQKAGVFIDDLLGQQQVVIKSLETNFRRVEGVSGATILGDGTVALILDVAGLVRLHRNNPNMMMRSRLVKDSRDVA